MCVEPKNSCKGQRLELFSDNPTIVLADQERRGSNDQPDLGWDFGRFFILDGARGGAVVEALRYKPEGRGIDSRWCHWNFSLS
jgi:hypothetical protein